MKKNKCPIDPAFVAEIQKNKTLKKIIIYGTKKGQNKRPFIYLNDKKEPEECTFNSTWEQIISLGTYMYSQGLNGKKKIAILSENSYQWIVSFYSILVGGNIAVPMDIKLSVEDIVSQLVRGECDGIVYSKKCEKFADAVKENPDSKVRVFMCIDDYPEYKAQGKAIYDGGNHSFEDAPVSPDDLACIVYTSGTTGLSKGVMLSHKNVTADVVASCSIQTGRQAIGFLPLNHTFCWVGALFSGYLLAEWGYICDSLKDIEKDIQTYHPHNFSAVPLVVTTIYDKIWRKAKKRGQDKKLEMGLKISRFLMKMGIDRRRKLFKEIIDGLGGELEFIICGGANLDPKYEQGMYDFGIQILNGYGMTECSPAVTVNTPYDFKFGSCGKPIPCCEIKIVDPDEFGVGELYVRGDNVMVGYYNDPEATAEVFDGEWLKTGDYCRIDDEGYLFYVGRKKNLLVLTNGHNVIPEEIEDKLICIDYVSEVLVYQEDDRITAEFFLNEEDYPDARDRLKDDVRKVNDSMPVFKRVTKTKIRDTEFEKTTTMKIERKNYINK